MKEMSCERQGPSWPVLTTLSWRTFSPLAVDTDAQGQRARNLILPLSQVQVRCIVMSLLQMEFPPRGTINTELN